MGNKIVQVADLVRFVDKLNQEAPGEKTSWDVIALWLNRHPTKCMNKYKSLMQSKRTANLKKGAFTSEEDEFIARRYTELQQEGITKGLWLQMEQELGRPAASINQRWKGFISKSDPTNTTSLSSSVSYLLPSSFLNTEQPHK